MVRCAQEPAAEVLCQHSSNGAWVITPATGHLGSGFPGQQLQRIVSHATVQSWECSIMLAPSSHCTGTALPAMAVSEAKVMLYACWCDAMNPALNSSRALLRSLTVTDRSCTQQ